MGDTACLFNRVKFRTTPAPPLIQPPKLASGLLPSPSNLTLRCWQRTLAPVQCVLPTYHATRGSFTRSSQSRLSGNTNVSSCTCQRRVGTTGVSAARERERELLHCEFLL